MSYYWYDAQGTNAPYNWPYRARITIPISQVGSGGVTSFPVYVNLANLGTNFANWVRTDGGDVRVTQSDGVTEVAREIVTISTSGSVPNKTCTGELHFNANSLSSSSNNTFYLYFGNPSATDYATNAAYGAQNVWDTNYKGVWHLRDGSTLSATDSTSGANNLTLSATPPTAVAGKIDGAGNFVKTSSENATIASVLGLGITNVTLSAWVYVPSTSEKGLALSVGYSGGYGFGVGNNVDLQTTGNSLMGFYNNVRYVGTSNNIGTAWHSIDMTIDGSSVPTLYLDGVSLGAFPGSNPFYPNTTTYIGGGNVGATERFWNGYLDEARISSTARSAAWITTQYNNQNAPTSFYTVALEAYGNMQNIAGD